MQKYSKEIKEFIKENAINKSNKEITELVNKKFNACFTVQQIKGFKNNHKISSGLTGHFEKGHIPANKGKKGIWYKGSEKTWFKKGSIPKNHRPVGSERISKDGYIEVKIQEPNKWKMKH